MRRFSRSAAGAGLSAVVMVGMWGAPALAAPVLTCPTGYLCLYPASGIGQLVPQGDARSFTPSLAVREIDNRTTLSYCVTGSLSFIIRPGTSAVRPDLVSAVTPLTLGTLCPAAAG